MVPGCKSLLQLPDHYPGSQPVHDVAPVQPVLAPISDALPCRQPDELADQIDTRARDKARWHNNRLVDCRPFLTGGVQ